MFKIQARAFGALERRIAESPTVESCGFLLGQSVETDVVLVSDVVPVRNVLQSPFQYAISRFELEPIERICKIDGLSLVAVFHSHPSGSRCLSGGDRVNLARSDLPWVIAGSSPFEAFGVSAYDTPDGNSLAVQILDYIGDV